MAYFKKGSIKSAIWVGLFTVFIAFIIGIGSETLMRFLSGFWVALILLLVIIFIGVGFDVIGTAVTAASIGPFNAKASKKIFGATQAVKILSNTSKVANYCNDVIGDICGTLSGAIGISIVYKIIVIFPMGNAVLLSALVTGLVAGITVGSKALGKTVAVAHANDIIFRVALVLAVIENKTKITFFNK